MIRCDQNTIGMAKDGVGNAGWGQIKDNFGLLGIKFHLVN